MSDRSDSYDEWYVSSLFRYSTSDPYNPPLLAGFIVDLNDEAVKMIWHQWTRRTFSLLYLWSVRKAISND